MCVAAWTFQSSFYKRFHLNSKLIKSVENVVASRYAGGRCAFRCRSPCHHPANLRFTNTGPCCQLANESGDSDWCGHPRETTWSGHVDEDNVIDAVHAVTSDDTWSSTATVGERFAGKQWTNGSPSRPPRSR